MKRKQTAGDWSYSDLLDAIPEPNPDSRTEAMSDGGLFITFRIRVSAFRRAPFKWFAKDRPFRYQRQLDAVGRELWEMMDGRTRMEPIIERFADRHRISFHEARLAIMAFIKSLHQVGAITLRRAAPPRG